MSFAQTFDWSQQAGEGALVYFLAASKYFTRAPSCWKSGRCMWEISSVMTVNSLEVSSERERVNPFCCRHRQRYSSVSVFTPSSTWAGFNLKSKHKWEQKKWLLFWSEDVFFFFSSVCVYQDFSTLTQIHTLKTHQNGGGMEGRNPRLSERTQTSLANPPRNGLLIWGLAFGRAPAEESCVLRLQMTRHTYIRLPGRSLPGTFYLTAKCDPGRLS